MTQETRNAHAKLLLGSAIKARSIMFETFGDTYDDRAEMEAILAERDRWLFGEDSIVMPLSEATERDITPHELMNFCIIAEQLSDLWKVHLLTQQVPLLLEQPDGLQSLLSGATP